MTITYFTGYLLLMTILYNLSSHQGLARPRNHERSTKSCIEDEVLQIMNRPCQLPRQPHIRHARFVSSPDDDVMQIHELLEHLFIKFRVIKTDIESVINRLATVTTFSFNTIHGFTDNSHVDANMLRTDVSRMPHKTELFLAEVSRSLKQYMAYAHFIWKEVQYLQCEGVLYVDEVLESLAFTLMVKSRTLACWMDSSLGDRHDDFQRSRLHVPCPDMSESEFYPAAFVSLSRYEQFVDSVISDINSVTGSDNAMVGK